MCAGVRDGWVLEYPHPYPLEIAGKIYTRTHTQKTDIYPIHYGYFCVYPMNNIHIVIPITVPNAAEQFPSSSYPHSSVLHIAHFVLHETHTKVKYFIVIILKLTLSYFKNFHSIIVLYSSKATVIKQE